MSDREIKYLEMSITSCSEEFGTRADNGSMEFELFEAAADGQVEVFGRLQNSSMASGQAVFVDICHL